jgi:hypothetical protein
MGGGGVLRGPTHTHRAGPGIAALAPHGLLG